MKFWLVLLAAGMTLTASAVEAAIRPHAFFLHPHGGFYDFHDDEVQKDAPVYGLGLGYRFSRNWSSEVIANFIDSERKGDEQKEIDGYLLRWEAQYGFRPGSRVVPYLAVGIGGILFDHRGGSTDLDGLIGYGIGVQAFVSERLSLRLDGRHFLTIQDSKLEEREFNNLMASAGLVVEIGGEEEKPQLIDTDGDGVIDAFDRCVDTPLGVPVDGYGCPADSDRDGVPDFQDRCAGTPVGASVNSDGCPPGHDSDGDGVVDARDKCPGTPAGVPVDIAGCPRDQDGDGVADHVDQCPDTPAGTKVDEKGCPLPLVKDGDADGVEDARDKCPGTPAGVAVDAAGCPRDSDADGVPDVLDGCPGTPAGVSVDAGGCPPKPAPKQSLNVHLDFPRGQSALGPEDHDRLREAIDFVRANPERRLVVEGHTDSIGSAEANLRLSRERAENVRRFLIDQTQADPERITVEAYGETRPAADNATPEGRLQNRRVVIRVE